MQKEHTIDIMHHDTLFTKNGSNIRYHFWKDEPTSLHRHECYEFFVVTENRLVHQFNGKSRVLETGTLGLLRPGDVHQLRSFRNEPCVHFNLSVSSTLFENLCMIINPNLFDLVASQTEMILYTLNTAEYDYFWHIIQLAQVSTEKLGQRDHPAMMRVMAHNFLLYLSLHWQTKSDKNNLPSWLSEFLTKLSLPEVFCLPMAKIYALSGYSQPRLNTLFRQYMGTTLISYITQQKTNYACTLLRTTNYKVVTICGLAGFNSISRFNYVFKDLTGLTPTQYQEKYSTFPISSY